MDSTLLDMLISTDNISVYYHSLDSLSVLRFDFKGVFDLRTCQIGVGVWKRELSRDLQRKQMLLWDCSQMTDVDDEALNEWVRNVRMLSERIDQVVFVSADFVFRNASQSVLRLFAFKHAVFESIGTFKKTYVHAIG